MRKELPSQTELLKEFVYDKNTGQLYRNQRPTGSLRQDGYLCVGIYNQQFAAHRIVWKMFYGTEPERLDHIDGDRTNNRLNNLRECSHDQNQQNAKINQNNTSGLKGVSFEASRNKWVGVIQVNKKTHKKRFSTFEEAAVWVTKLRERLHNDFARYL